MVFDEGRVFMAKQTALQREIETLPPSCFDEVLDFVIWIKRRKLSPAPETMLLSESALSRDWDTPEEDEAWANL